jgi:radical SAM superfamily enzyme YgiQ (UPF0313 family)
MKNVVFIDPRGFSDGMNTGLGYMSSVLLNSGYNVSVIDFNNSPGNEKKRLEAVKDAGFVGISIKSYTLWEAVRLGSLVKKINPRTILIAGGPHITIDGIEFMKTHGFFDLAVAGEGEEAMKQVVSGKPFEKIKGLIYRKGGKVVKKDERCIVADISQLPLPVYDNFDSRKKMKSYPLITSRGCPYNCSYCSVGNIIGKKWRARNPERIVEELSQAKKKYKIKEFGVLDDDFTLDMGRAKKFCRLLIENKLDLRWSCPNGVRADKLDEELIGLMKESGCNSISLGIESLDENVFAMIDKGEQLSAITGAVAMIKKAGMKVNGFFIIGLPGSTYRKDMETLEKAKKLRLDHASWGILVPYPGTRVWDWIHSNGKVRILQDWRKGFHIGLRPKPVFETADYPAKERINAFYKANLAFVKKKDIPKIVKIVAKNIFR